jgi:glucose/arabinose dehydrogenase
MRSTLHLRTSLIAAGALLLGVVALPTLSAIEQDPGGPFTDYRGEKPGTTHKITVRDLPRPYATVSADNQAHVVPRPASAWPQAPTGFTVDQYATGLAGPRLIRTAPNGDLFVSETGAGRIRVIRDAALDGVSGAASSAAAGASPGAAPAAHIDTFAQGLTEPFGLAFYPPGPDPNFLYVANTNSVVRFPYKNGDLNARGPQQVVVSRLTSDQQSGGHSTRDIAFSLDGSTLYISVGSASNVDDVDNNPAEVHRANILETGPEGGELHVYASGIRNPVGLAVEPVTGDVWTSVNERDGLGDNLPPDYITHVQRGGFYGWPWYYIGGNQDPRLAGKHPELRSHVIVPDVLVQPHNASLQLTFYDGSQFPDLYQGDIFAAEHGSWNKSVRAGYEVIRVRMTNGRATGTYEDFLTGFVTASGQVWGRPVGVAVAADGSLMVSDDGSSSIWRVRYSAQRTNR